MYFNYFLELSKYETMEWKCLASAKTYIFLLDVNIFNFSWYNKYFLVEKLFWRKRFIQNKKSITLSGF